MKQLVIPFALALTLATPVAAQDSDDMGEGIDLLEEGARLLLRGLLSEMDPALDELRGFADEMGPKMRLFAQEMGPAFAELMAQVDDFSNYAAPEFLPNGDIIIKRRPGAPLFVPDVPEGSGEIDL